MTTLTLTFTGPQTQARPALVGLLQRFRTAYFEERAVSEYAVTTDEATAAALAREPQWLARPGAATERRQVAPATRA